ncbi:MAG TPA: HAD family phosphatase [Acidimicrobiales bacterium]|nr:HAD family phosphatase [Acidimicrobiales bacterium]
MDSFIGPSLFVVPVVGGVPVDWQVVAAPIEFVLFDLGGVLIDPGGVEPMRQLSGLASEDEVWARWLACRWVRAFEAGQCSPEEFAAGVVADWELSLTPAEFLDVFSGWPGTPYPGALDFVTEVRDRLPVGYLSNTNPVQWHANYAGTPVTEAFAYRFLSFELGLVKPDRAIFDVVAGRLPVPPERVLFLDDNAVNVDAAVGAGFEARHVRRISGARAALVETGVLRD